MTVVGRATRFHRTTAPAAKFDPLTVSENALPPATALDGVSDVTAAGGLTTLKLTGADAPPPGAGLSTVTGIVPTFATSSGRIVAVNWVALPNTVDRARPFHNTDEPVMKFVPRTIKV